jgi:hypothetical protein
MLSDCFFAGPKLAANAGGPVLPEKKREPTSKETDQEYSKLNLNTLISGHFNGDGLVDGTAIVITKDNQSQELITFIYNDKGDETCRS